MKTTTKTTTKTTETEVMQTEIAGIKPESVIRDEFASEEYIDPNVKLPRIQALRGEDPTQCGYFVPLSQAAKAGWLSWEEDQLIDYVFNSGETDRGLLFTSMRMLVCPRTPCLALDEKESKKQEQNVFIGYYKRSLYKDDPNVKNFQAFDVILLDKNNKPIHQIPLSLKLKGGAQGSFAGEWDNFIEDMTNCHRIVNNMKPHTKKQPFKSLCVFVFNVKREMVGDKIKSPACKVVGYEKPTLENWKDYFVGFDADTKDFTFTNLPDRPLIAPQENQLALAGSPDHDSDIVF
jgi:hypothetical protein